MKYRYRITFQSVVTGEVDASDIDEAREKAKEEAIDLADSNLSIDEISIRPVEE